MRDFYSRCQMAQQHIEFSLVSQIDQTKSNLPQLSTEDVPRGILVHCLIKVGPQRPTGNSPSSWAKVGPKADFPHAQANVAPEANGPLPVKVVPRGNFAYTGPAARLKLPRQSSSITPSRDQSPFTLKLASTTNLSQHSNHFGKPKQSISPPKANHVLGEKTDIAQPARLLTQRSY